MHDLVIVGAGGFGRELHALLWDAFSREEFRFKGFLAGAQSPEAARLGPLLGDPDQYEPTSADRFLLAIGNMVSRRRTVEALEQREGKFISYIHPTAIIAGTASVADGAVIYPYAVVSNCAVLQPHVHLNYFASIGHDAQVGMYCLLAPYATLNGGCRIEQEVYVSTHATVAAGRSVGAQSKLSANSAAMQDVPDHSMVFGVPGRIVRRIG